MNIPTLMTKVAALSGHPIRISSHPAPYDATDSVVVVGDPAQQISPSRRGLRMMRGVEYARSPDANGASVRLRMDVISHTDGQPRPAVVFVPGGGVVASPRMAAGGIRRHLAQAGYVVAIIEYRTTRSGSTYVEGVADVKSAVRFLRENADRFGVDPGRIALWGESAGGYLAAMAGVTPGDPVQAVVNKFGGSDLTLIAAGFDEATVAANTGPGTSFARYVLGPTAEIGLADRPDEVRAADPATYAAADLPPFLHFHGSDDRIISPVQTLHLHAALRAVGADSTRYLVTGAGHGDIAVKRGEEKLWTTQPMLAITTEFLARALAPESAQ